MMMEHEIEVKVNFTVEDCYDAILEAVSTLKNYEITDENEIIGTVQIKVKGLTASPGDYVTVTILHETSDITKVLIRGGVKVPYLLAKKNCIKNAEAIAAAFANEIKNYEKAGQSASKSKSDDSVENKLERLKNMYQKDLLTQEEYEQKKKEIINSMFN